MMTKEQFLNRIIRLTLNKWAEEPGKFDTVTDMLCWMVAYFEAEDDADMSTADVARTYLMGRLPIDAQYAQEWFEELYNMYPEDSLQDREDTVEDTINRVYRFLYPVTQFVIRYKEDGAYESKEGSGFAVRTLDEARKFTTTAEAEQHALTLHECEVLPI
jgi:hypothetical protein